MKRIEVVAALIARDEKILATRRRGGRFDGKWEFPGGKIENGETPEEALHREITEELGIGIDIQAYITDVDYDYPDFHLNMRCYLCTPADDSKLSLNVHGACAWVTPQEASTLEFLPADDGLVAMLPDILKKSYGD